jgi:outer membrane protein OmpA-like peptidoglycan-associated protein
VTFEGYGEARPVAPNDSPQGRALNRRVEFTILEAGE